MTASVQACPGKPENSQPPLAGRTCPECAELYVPRQRQQLFCSVAHRDVFNARIAARGKILTPLAMVARVTRDGSRGAQAERGLGKRASAEASILMQRWRDEDRAANRMAWPEYLARRYAAGFDPL
jgi:hypothetical protein